MDIDDVLDAIGGKYEYECEDEYAEIGPYLCIIIWTKDVDDDSIPNWSIMTTEELEEIEELNKIQGFKQNYDVIVFQNIDGFQDEVIEYYKLQKKFNSLKLTRQIRIALNESYDSEEIDHKIDEIRENIMSLHAILNQKI